MKSNKRKSIFLVVLFSCLLIVLGVVFLLRQKQVTLVLDGNPRSLITRAITVAGLLKDEGINYSDKDRVLPANSHLLRNESKVIVDHSRQISFEVGGEEFKVESVEAQPQAWLEIAGISLLPEDRLFVDDHVVDPVNPLPYQKQHLVQVNPLIHITILVDGVSKQIVSSAHSVGEALRQAGEKFSANDRLAPPANTTITRAMTITLLKAHPLHIQAGEKTIEVSISADTIGSALALAGLSLQGMDYSIPDENEPLPADGKIRIVRVSEEIIQNSEIIPFETEFKAQADMDLDTRNIIQFGKKGQSVSLTRIRFEDGEEVSRITENKRVLQEPVNQIEAFGTRITVQSMSTADGPVEYYRALDFYATSYHPKMTSPPWYGAVACGGKWQPGYVAVDLNYIPCGTRLYIPGYGFGVAMDTAYISGAWIDLGYPDDNYVIWHRHVTVYFLTPVPAPEQVHWIIPPGSLY